MGPFQAVGTSAALKRWSDMKHVDHHVELSPDEARQGQIILDSPLLVAIFVAGLAGLAGLAFLLMALAG